MSFKDDVRLALAPNAIEPIPHELHFGKIAYSWTNKKLERKNRTPGFRKLVHAHAARPLSHNYRLRIYNLRVQKHFWGSQTLTADGETR
jgi:hypothetical protein